MKQTIESLIEGGKASPGPPLGPAIGPLGLNINEVIGKINEETADMNGMKVPIKLIIDTKTKEYEIKVGTPPTAALIKKEAGIGKGTQDGTHVGNISMEQLITISKIKSKGLLSRDMKNIVKEIAGTCKSAGVTIEDLDPTEFTKKVDSGEFDDKLSV
ncbi:MAG: 50S ribosomal protein L11 [Candidatus Altiarchaeota archaeon]|nr:50S ribosomal protein L11 [Candidatus Altiarchaeota archaeon]